MQEYSIKNNIGLEVVVLNKGFSFKQIFLKKIPILMEYEDLKSFNNNDIFLNSFVGPVAGRIEKGIIKIRNQNIKLKTNENDNYIHGGDESWANMEFDIVKNNSENSNKLIGNLITHNKELDCNYEVEIIVSIPNNKNEINIVYKVKVDKETICNPTQHLYWRLSSEDEFLNQSISIPLKGVWKINQNFCTQKKLFLESRKFTKVQDLMIFNQAQNKLVNDGVDHSFVLGKGPIVIQSNNISLTMESSFNDVVIYSHNWPSKNKIKNASRNKNLAICFEFQHTPTSILNNNFKDITISKDKRIFLKQITKLNW